MSYDLTIRSDDDFSRRAKVKPLADCIATLPEMRPNGEGFTFGDHASRYMEIDFEFVSEEGDNIEEHGREHPEINCVALHIPYPSLGDAPERDYFPTAFAIAAHLGWRVFDAQRGEYLDPEKENLAVPLPRGVFDEERGESLDPEHESGT